MGKMISWQLGGIVGGCLATYFGLTALNFHPSGDGKLIFVILLLGLGQNLLLTMGAVASGVSNRMLMSALDPERPLTVRDLPAVLEGLATFSLVLPTYGGFLVGIAIGIAAL